jgi:hypothetical protein
MSNGFALDGESDTSDEQKPYSVKLVLREIASAASESRAADKKIFSCGESQGGG